MEVKYYRKRIMLFAYVLDGIGETELDPSLGLQLVDELLIDSERVQELGNALGGLI
jgi:hypothetical protein